MPENEIYEIAYVIEPLFQYDDEADKTAEIKELVSSAGAEVYGCASYSVREIIPATFIGSGKLAEIREAVKDTPVNLVVFDGELSPSQTLNISSALGGVKVVDRTTLILDIFALNAKSNEGKLQVELAQLKYIYPRLKGKGEALSRLGGGIGTRGPGETKLETDRRHIRARINSLENKLKELETRRDIQMRRREKNSCPTVALVGYTNTGKSTLLNALTDADAFVKDQLFATLDPTVRKFQLADTQALLIDTVGFVRNIPHHIIEAFKSTLELAVRADLILN
ncbi:MAG: GTPase HflX, partial [Clostridia bacterium]|nr:GTPase HflX [Clostridia bacterium]